MMLPDPRDVAHELARIAFFTACILAAMLLLRAQGPRSEQSQIEQARENALRLILGADDSTDEARALSEHKAQSEAARQFSDKFNDLVIQMNRLKDGIEKGIFNRKQALIVTKAWRKLRVDPGWLEKDKEKSE
jgi:hypothetical protein